MQVVVNIYFSCKDIGIAFRSFRHLRSCKKEKKEYQKESVHCYVQAYLYLLHKKYFGVKNRYVLNNEKTRKKSVTIFFRVRLKYSMNYSH